jgi:F0F1-type ATP synthase assembly protein I
MPDDRPPDSRELGYYFTLAQVGLEMVAPLIVGLVLDYYLDTGPWLAVGGIIIGFIGGITHIVALTHRHDAEARDRTPRRGGGDAP